MARSYALVLAFVILAASLALRTVALDTDAYGRLDWSAGLLTDEGFYTHNARNVALFGAPRTDEFNNMLLSPGLHALQAWVLRTWGVGAVQVRMISALAGLLSVALLGWVLLRAVSPPAALAGMAVLGLDHTSALFSRLALMDTPAALGCTAGLACFVGALAARRPRWAVLAMLLCGVALASTVANRSLTLYILPAPVLALAYVAASSPRRLGARWVVARVAPYMAALALVGGLVAWSWVRPRSAEIRHMTTYYRTRQLQPKSPRHLGENLYRAAFGDHRGIAPYLFRHAPAPFVLVLAGLAAAALGRLGGQAPKAPADAWEAEAARRLRQGVLAFLAAWLACGWLLLAAVAYSPTRYAISTFPALAGLAGWAFASLPGVVARLASGRAVARALTAALLAFLAYHALQSLVHRGGPGTRQWVQAALVCAPAAVAGAWLWLQRRGPRTAASPGGPVAAWAAVAAVVWLATNGWWLADWARGLERTQIAFSRRLGRELPAGSVLIGDVAPGVCMDNRHVAVNVINGLCNGDRPVERYAGRPRYIVILDGRWLEPYWVERYPDLVRPANRIMLARVLRWDVGVYRVPADFGLRTQRISNGRVRPEGKTG